MTSAISCPLWSSGLQQSVVSDKRGKSLLSVNVDNTDNRLKHDCGIEIGEPTSKALKKRR